MRSKTYDVNFSSNDARWQNAATVKQLLDILLLAITYNMFDYWYDLKGLGRNTGEMWNGDKDMEVVRKEESV